MFRLDGYFGRFMSVAWDVIWVGLLWLICSLPIITLGASTTAAYYAMSKSVRHKTGYVSKEFFRSFKLNFKNSTILTFVFILLAGVIAIDVWYVWNHDNKTNSAIFVVLMGIAFCIACITVYVCPLLSRFEKKNFDLVKMAAVVAFKYLPISIGIIIVFALVCIGVWLMPWAVFFIPGVYFYLLSFPMEMILRKLMPKPEEGSEEALKWYYQ